MRCSGSTLLALERPPVEGEPHDWAERADAPVGVSMGVARARWSATREIDRPDRTEQAATTVVFEK